MNKFIGSGRLTKEPEVRYTSGSEPKAVARYTLAINRDHKNADGNVDADFLNCVTFGKNGEFAEKYLHKGMKIAIEGRIQTGSYEKDGKKIYTTDIVVERHEFVESKKETNAASNDEVPSGFSEIDPDELPF